MKGQRSWTTALVVGVIALTSGGWLINQGVEGGVVESRRLLSEVHRLLADRFVDEVPPDELYRMAIDGMLEQLGDPYTDFLDPREREDLRYSTTGNYGGLGVRIDSKDDWITIVQVLPDSPALREGLMVGDRIVAVEGESAEGWTQDKAVSVLRGEKGDPVNITIARVGAAQPLNYRFVRDRIQVVQAQGFMLEDRIGFVQLRGFTRQAQEEMVEAIDRLIDNGARGLILDLRMNPGGLLEEGISVTDLFLEQGAEVVETRSRLPDQNYIYDAPGGERYPDIPMVVLVDRFSASASEIVAGALQDHDRAVIVGTTSFGKGSVQTLYGLSGDNTIKITTARWYTPVGRSIQKEFDRESAMQSLVENAVSISGEPVSQPEVADRERFYTSSGRVVYGGGGITPDLIVLGDTLSTEEQALRRIATSNGVDIRNLAFRWSVAWANDHEIDPGFRVTETMRTALFEALDEAGAGIDRDLFDASENWIDYLIAINVARAEFGEIEQLRAQASRDAQVKTAVDLLRRAETPAALLDVASREAEARESSGASEGAP
ncbi:MAG: S41 family peptidase [Gemmatimonadota bacterium]|nr:S41 family peptidase [Gemmatimonadota bacterium]